jgi:septum formation protein
VLTTEIPLILGSKSPRRQSLLKEAGFSFELRLADTDEAFPASLKGEAVPAYLAALKSDHITIRNKECLITADTVVCCDDAILNKPADAAEAREMLKLLSGRTHWVHTGVCLRQGTKKHVFTESTEVYFRHLHSDEIDHYIAKYEPFDKAGAYGIQEWIGYIGVERIEGCFYNVVGFPVSRFVVELRQFLAE